jgi:hypothetical protein
VDISREAFTKIVQLLSPLMDDPERRSAIVYTALYDSPILNTIDFTGSGATFSSRLIATLINRLEYNGLLAILNEIKFTVGPDRVQYIQDLINEISKVDKNPAPINKKEGVSSTSNKSSALRWVIIVMMLATISTSIAWLLSTESKLEPLIALLAIIPALFSLIGDRSE